MMDMKLDTGATDAPPSAAERDAQSGDPFVVVAAWMAEAEASEPNDANAMSLATVDEDGLPNLRIVLLKGLEPTGDDGARGAFVFYTNYESAKGRELTAHPKAALTLHWKTLRRQVRARGVVERVSAQTSDAYYETRPYQSRIGAWASRQSQPLESRAALIGAAAATAARYPLQPPRPSHWGGFRITPVEIEFWSDGAFRMHDRFQWRWETPERGGPAGWVVRRLSP